MGGLSPLLEPGPALGVFGIGAGERVELAACGLRMGIFSQTSGLEVA
jgi:hypothetical protein